MTNTCSPDGRSGYCGCAQFEKKTKTNMLFVISMNMLKKNDRPVFTHTDEEGDWKYQCFDVTF